MPPLPPPPKPKRYLASDDEPEHGYFGPWVVGFVVGFCMALGWFGANTFCH